VNLKTASFTDRTAAIAAFRAKLEELEDNSNFSWFNHKNGTAGREVTTFAGYLDLPTGDLLSKHQMQWRYRRQLTGNKPNKTDFVIKYKEANSFFPNLKPMTASPAWADAWSCKVEDNLKFVQCPTKPCFPDGACYRACPADGPPGIGLEAQEQAPKIKGNPGDAFAEQFTSVNQFKTIADVTAFFPDVASFFELGDASTALSVSKKQYRWIFEKVDLEFDEVKVESNFQLWYNSEEDLKNGAEPYKGEWSFAFDIEAGSETKTEQADQLLNWIGTMIPSVLVGPAGVTAEEAQGVQVVV